MTRSSAAMDSDTSWSNWLTTYVAAALEKNNEMLADYIKHQLELVVEAIGEETGRDERAIEEKIAKLSTEVETLRSIVKADSRNRAQG